MQALWMLLAAFLFATMAVCVKFASQHFNSAELVFWRGLISMLFMLVVARAARVPLATPVPKMHLWRNIAGVFALGSWFYAIGQLPLATAMTLNYMSSIWIAAFLVGGGLLLGRERVPGALLLTVLAGFVGVVLVLRPTLEQNQLFAGVVGLLSGIATALAYLQVAALARAGEPEARTVFYFGVGSTAGGAVALLFTGLSPFTWQGAVWIVPMGVLASLGQLCMTRAYSRGSTLLVANLQYAGIVFASFYSLVLFGDQIPLAGWCGMALIVASGMAATVLRSRPSPIKEP
ncbi:MAG: DMT family transporter [Pseudomonadota bacterium]